MRRHARPVYKVFFCCIMVFLRFGEHVDIEEKGEGLEKALT